jgi:hypothetical protein
MCIQLWTKEVLHSLEDCYVLLWLWLEESLSTVSLGKKAAVLGSCVKEKTGDVENAKAKSKTPFRFHSVVVGETGGGSGYVSLLRLSVECVATHFFVL